MNESVSTDGDKPMVSPTSTLNSATTTTPDIELARHPEHNEDPVTSPSKAQPLGFSIIVQHLTVDYKHNPHCSDCLLGIRQVHGSTIRALDHCSFVARPGRVLAVVGPVGSGRSSLMNAIAGRVKPSSGTVRALNFNENRGNQQERSECCCGSKHSPASFSFVNGSDEHLLSNLTVYESLMNSAKLKLPSLSKQQRKEKVDFVLDRMQLSSCRNVYVGSSEWKSISTGERRRLTIAMELLDSTKSILLLDKPTTGVDSAQARQITELLSDIARTENKTIIFSLYQPTSGIFDAVDDILLLHHGRTIYCGPVGQVVDYFETSLGVKMAEDSCSADFVIDEVLRLDKQDDIEVASPTASTATHGNEIPTLSESQNAKSEKRSPVDEWKAVFLSSPHGQSIETQIQDAVSSNEHFHQLTSQHSKKSKSAGHAFGHFWASVFILCKRFVVNTYRSPLCWAPIILAIIQGTLMGGIMFQYPRQLPDEHIGDVEKLFPDGSITNTTFGHVFIEGIAKDEDGNARRPFADLLTNGIDGHGSKPIYDFAVYDNHKYIYKIRKGLWCLNDKWITPNNLYYPPNNWVSTTSTSSTTLTEGSNDGKSVAQSVKNPRNAFMMGQGSVRRLSTQWSQLRSNMMDVVGEASLKFWIDKADSYVTSSLSTRTKTGQEVSSIDDGPFEAHAAISDAMVALQVVDHIWNGRNYAKYYKTCKKFPNVNIEILFYKCVGELAGQYLLDAIECFEMPELPLPPPSLIKLGIPPLVEDYWALPTPSPSTKSSTKSSLRSLREEDRAFQEWGHFLRFLSTLLGVDSADDPKDVYDEEITAWDPEISKREWDKVHGIIDGLLPGMTVMDAVKLVLSPNTRGDLQKLPDIDKLKDLWSFVEQMVDWINIELPSTTTTTTTTTTVNPSQDDPHQRRQLQTVTTEGPTPPPKESRFCSSNFCREFRNQIPTVKRYATRMINRFKIILVQREFPRIVVSAWTALTTTGCLFATVATLGFFCFDALLSFHKDRLMFNREVANGTYRPLAFFLGKNLADIPFQLIPALIIASIWGGMAGVAPTASQFGTYLGISILVCFAAYGFCYMVSAATPRMEVAIVLAPLMLISWLILAGFIMRSDDLVPAWIRWYRHISLHRFGWFALMTNTFPEGGHFGVVPTSLIHWMMGIDELNIPKMVGILAALGFGFRFVGYVFLRFLYRKVGLLQH